MPTYEYRTSGHSLLWRTSSVLSVCLEYAYRIKHTSDTHKISASPYAGVCHRMRPCLKRIQPMPNVPLAYVSVYRRMIDIFHTLAYASTILTQ
jgi:hypothetical protein